MTSCIMLWFQTVWTQNLIYQMMAFTAYTVHRLVVATDTMVA